MKRVNSRICVTVLVSLVGYDLLYAQMPLGTEFTYQGQLQQDSHPLDGTADFEFTLWDADSGGNAVGAPVALNDIDVVNGVFTVPLDFGSDVFNGEARWLEIAVRSPAGAGAFTTLAPRQPLTATPYALQTRGIFVDDSSGNVGIGTDDPLYALQLDVPSSANEGIFLAKPGTLLGTRLAVRGSNNQIFGIDIDPNNGSGFEQFEITYNGTAPQFLIDTDGNVGIGTSAAPVTRLQVVGGYAVFGTTGGSNIVIDSNEIMARNNGSVASLFLNHNGGDVFVSDNGTGRLIVPVIEITGADLAEKFPTSEEVKPGMVVAIDPDNSGMLRLSRGAYNRRVAGVVSGANDFSVGAVLGNLPGHEDAPPIALSGRVYVWCDATDALIAPGDLLTTSTTPGHAMKVTDHVRAQGAIIGKAMTGLPGGRGLVLVLVSLQ